MKQCFILFFILCQSLFANQEHASITTPSFVILTASYNNLNWYEKNLDSIVGQKQARYRIIYIDDASEDQTAAAVETYLKKHQINYSVIEYVASDENEVIPQKFSEKLKQNKSFFTLIKNRSRCGAMENFFRTIHCCHNSEIIVSVDGDDWLPHHFVLKELTDVYSTGKVWITHGKFQTFPSNQVPKQFSIPKSIVKKQLFRKWRGFPSHLKTFYAGLFKKIHLEDLCYQGQFVDVASDAAMMFPMLEMAQYKHRFINQVLYIYNTKNPISDFKIALEKQKFIEHFIRQKPPYPALEKADFISNDF